MAAILIVYGVGYPISCTAALGIFSNLPKRSKAKAQGQFALAGSVARVVAPILTGYLESYERTASFSAALLLVGVSIVWIGCLMPELLELENLRSSQQSDVKSENSYPSHRTVGMMLLTSGILIVFASIGAITDWGGDDLYGWSS